MGYQCGSDSTRKPRREQESKNVNRRYGRKISDRSKNSLESSLARAGVEGGGGGVSRW